METLAQKNNGNNMREDDLIFITYYSTKLTYYKRSNARSSSRANLVQSQYTAHNHAQLKAYTPLDKVDTIATDHNLTLHNYNPTTHI